MRLRTPLHLHRHSLRATHLHPLGAYVSIRVRACIRIRSVHASASAFAPASASALCMSKHPRSLRACVSIRVCARARTRTCIRSRAVIIWKNPGMVPCRGFFVPLPTAGALWPRSCAVNSRRRSGRSSSSPSTWSAGPPTRRASCSGCPPWPCCRSWGRSRPSGR